MDTQTQIERLIELAIVQRGELRKLVGELPQLREHLNAEIERVFEETEPQLRVELEEFVAKQSQERTDAISAELKAKIDSFAKTLNQSAEAKYSALVAERAKNDDLLKQAEQNIAFAAQALPAQVKEIVTAELARFPRAGEIDQLRKEFAEPKGLNPRGKWSPDATYNKLDLVGYNGDSFVSNTDGNRERPSRTSESWTLNAARGTGGGGGLLSINDALGNPTSDFTIVGAEGNNYVQKTLVAGANITITESPTAITIIGDEGQISLQDGTAAAPSLFFTNDTDTGLYRPAANTLGISVSGTQIAYFDQNGLTIPAAGVVAGGSIHAANGNANNPSHSFSGDQDTGFFRHQPNEIGIALGGAQYATLTSTTFSITPSVTVGGTFRASGGIVGTAVGASSPSTGAFTTLSASTSLTSPDLTIGTSGPSAKSSIAARAARQGLVGDGTAALGTVTIPALGTNWTTSFWVKWDGAAQWPIIYGGGQFIGIRSSGTPFCAVELPSVTIPTGKWALLTLVGNGTTTTPYLNGVAGTAVADTTSYPNFTTIGASASSVDGIAIYNRALSTAEVVSLYEAGVPSGADYNSASNTSIITGAASDFSSDTGYWAKGNGATISGGKANLTGGAYSNISRAGLCPSGKKWRVTFTISTGDATGLYISDSGITALITGITGTGTKTYDFTGGPQGGFQIVSPSGTGVIDDLLIYPLGLLLAPDAGQAGGGLTWCDTSGNAANITLPASGVTWNVPTSGKMATSLTIGGTGVGLTLAPSSGAASMTLNGPAAGSSVNFALTGTNKYTAEYVNGSDFFAIGRSGVAYDLVLKSGNVLIGTTTDGGQKLQVAGTGIVKGNFYSARSDNTGSIQLIPTSGVSAGSDIESFNGSSSIYARLNMRTETFQIFTGSSGNTLCATFSGFDNSATFAGTVRTTALGIGTAPNSYYTIFGTGTLTGNSNQAFLNAAPTFDSGATGQGNVLWVQGKTAAASYTVAALSGIKIESPSLGAGSSVTTVYGLRIQAQTGGTTNHAIYTDGGNVRFGSLPTSSAGLPSGAIWNNSGVLNIVP